MKLLIPLAIGILTTSCQKELEPKNAVLVSGEQTTNSVAITDPNDPNNNPNWSFANPSQQTALIYYGQKIAGQPVQSTEVALPWFTAGNPINNENQDYKPELGWVLYLKDFGTAQRPAQTPFFALYNKYSGVLRFFVYNYRVRNQGEASKTYYAAELGFNNVSNYNSSLAFFAPVNQFVKDKVNPNNKQIVLTQKGASDTWMNFDFTMMYDVNPKELRLNIYGSSQAEINLGTDFSTLTARSSVGASGSSTSGFAQAVTNGYEYASSTQSFLDAITKLQDKTGGSTASTLRRADNRAATDRNNNVSELTSGRTTISAIPIAVIGAAVGVVKGVIGIVKSFTGGKKSATNTQTTIQYSGIVNTTGTATISNNLYSIQFQQDANASLSANRYRPLYQQKIGLLGSPDKFFLTASQFNYQCADNSRNRLVQLHNFNTGFSYDKFIEGFINNPDINGKISITKFDAYLINNSLAQAGVATPDLASQNNSFNFLRFTPEVVNGGVTHLSNHTPPVNVRKGWDNDEFQAIFGRYAFASNAGSPFDTNGLNHPKIGIEIHYTIVDPTYPLADSRERIIHKVVAPTLEYRNTGITNTGCPTNYQHVYWP